MTDLATYLDMGGYARFVWPAYGLAALVMIGLVTASLRTLRCRERELETLQKTVPGRRGRLPAPSPNDREHP